MESPTAERRRMMSTVSPMDRDAWDRRYEEAELIWSAEPNQLLPPAVEGVEPGKALDLAAGEGRNAVWLASQGWDCTAVDFSTVAIEKGRRLAETQGLDVEWVVDNVLAYEPEPIHDLVMIFFVHLADTQMEQLFRVARAALKPGGRLIGLGHALRNLTEGYGGPQVAEVLWTEDRIRPLLDGMTITACEEVLRPVVAKPGETIAEGTTAIDLWIDATT